MELQVRAVSAAIIDQIDAVGETAEVNVMRYHVDGTRTQAAPTPNQLSGDVSPLVKEFRQLVRRWKDETAQSSDPRERIIHPAYLRIIGLGPEVLPLVFAELQQRPSLWFWALEALTGVDPVPDGTQSMKAAREAWLEWGRQNHYV